MLQRLALRLRAAADRASPRSGSAEGAAVCGHAGRRRLGAGAPILALVARLGEGVEYAFERARGRLSRMPRRVPPTRMVGDGGTEESDPYVKSATM